MVVERRDLEAGILKLRDQGVDFGFSQDEVAMHDGLVASLAKRGPAAEGEARLDGDAMYGDSQIGSRHADAIDVALELTGHAKGLLDRGGIDRAGRLRRGAEGPANNQNSEDEDEGRNEFLHG